MRNRPPADQFFLFPTLTRKLTAVLALSRTLRAASGGAYGIPDCRCARRCVVCIGTGNIKAALRAGSKRPAARIEQGTGWGKQEKGRCFCFVLTPDRLD